MGGWISQWWLDVAGKQPERVAAVAITDPKNNVAGGHCGSASGGHGYKRVAEREMITTVPIVWPEEGRGVSDAELK